MANKVTPRLTFQHALMSHRGGSLEHVENTLPAFRHSANVLKVYLLELDCQLTKDVFPVIFHDNDLKRMCGLKKTIRDFDYKDLPPLIVPENLPENVKCMEESTKIPLLEDLFKEFPTYPMQIDVKYGPEELVIKVGNMIKKYNREKQTAWGTFQWSVNRLCYKHFGTDIPLFFDIPSAMLSFCMWGIGLKSVYASLVKPRFSCLILPNVKFLMRRGWFASLNSLGIPVLLFGLPTGSIHTIEGYHQARKAGANGICTDKPSSLKEYLNQFPLKKVDEPLK